VTKIVKSEILYTCSLQSGSECISDTLYLLSVSVKNEVTPFFLALKLNRKFIGIELYPEWFEVAKKRIDNCLYLFQNSSYTLYLGDSLEVMKEKLKDNSVDFIVTSPPYWNILDKVDRKAKKERISNNLPTPYGFHEKDLARISDY